MKPIVEVQGLSKLYRLGVIGSTTLRDAVERMWARVRGRPVAVSRLAALASLEGRRGPRPNTFWAIRDVSFSLERGTILGLIGSNGAGKSTVLKILSQITDPTEGEATIRGRIASLLEVGTGFHPELTGRENIFLNGAMLGMRRLEIRDRLEEIIAFSEVGEFIDTPVKRYSSGMYVRLAFAVAAHLEPEVLVVDEVLAVGDAAFQKKCLGKIGDVARAGRTILFVSHNMTAVQSLCDRVLWLRQGRVVDDGPAARVVPRYLASAQPSVAERLWDDAAGAPGNEKVRLRRARVGAEDGSAPEAITTRTPLRLEFEYWNLQPGAHLNLSLHVYNERGILVFNALPVNEAVWQGRPLPVGLFRDVCRIPGDLLNDGGYRIELLVVQDEGTVICRYDDILAFHVHDSVEMRGAWYGDWDGVVRPTLEWTTEYLGAGDEAGAARPSGTSAIR